MKENQTTASNEKENIKEKRANAIDVVLGHLKIEIFWKKSKTTPLPLKLTAIEIFEKGVACKSLCLHNSW